VRLLARALAALTLVLLVAGSVDARTWAWLGVRIRDLSETEMDDLASKHGIGEGFGVVVVEVMPDTPAARAGMRNGDVIVALDARPVTDTRLLQRLIARAPVDRDIRLVVLRSEGRRPLAVRLVTMPPPVAGERMAQEFGFVLREPEAAAERPSAGSPAVSLVVKGSAADKGGLEVGDVILQINDRSVVTRDAAREALADLPADRPLRLTVRREERYVSLTLAAPADGRP
jgi:S1-C subfamily serine protease